MLILARLIVQIVFITKMDLYLLTKVVQISKYSSYVTSPRQAMKHDSILNRCAEPLYLRSSSARVFSVARPFIF